MMKFSLIILTIMASTVSADVTHLVNRNLTPNNYHYQNYQHYLHQQHNHHDSLITVRPSNESVETTIEKHEVVELPTQIEIVKEGQSIYGIQPQSMEISTSSYDNNKIVPYLKPKQEIVDFQPPLQVSYEIPMRIYLPPLATVTTNTVDKLPHTTTMTPFTTTYNPTTEDITTNTSEQQFTTEKEMNDTITEMPTMDTTTVNYPTETVTMPENHYLPPLNITPQNQYLSPLDIMLPPRELMPQQPTYKQYQEQLLHEQQMQKIYREQEMQKIMHIIAKMEKQQMITLEPQLQQPVAPVEPAYNLHDNGYHYKMSDDDERHHYRYRH